MSTKTIHERSVVLAAVLCPFLLAVTTVSIAQIGNAGLGGTVTDQSGAAIPGAVLTLTNSATGFKATFTSDNSGEYSFRNLTPGTYDLVATKNGFRSYSQKGIVIGKGGARLRDVGTKARTQIEKLLGTKIYLELHVKVAKDWQRDPKQLGRLGF